MCHDRALSLACFSRSVQLIAELSDSLPKPRPETEQQQVIHDNHLFVFSSWGQGKSRLREQRVDAARALQPRDVTRMKSGAATPPLPPSVACNHHNPDSICSTRQSNDRVRGRPRPATFITRHRGI